MENYTSDSEKKFTVLAGGGGGQALLRSLCVERVSNGENLTQMPDSQISGVTTTTDSGGSSGDLMKLFDIPPVGDAGKQIGAGITNPTVQRHFLYRHHSGTDNLSLRQSCNVIVEELQGSTHYHREDLLEQIQDNVENLIQELGSTTNGHTNSNLFIASRIIFGGKTFTEALRDVQLAFGSRVRVYPVTNERMELVMHDGSEKIAGEHLFDRREIQAPDNVRLEYQSVRPITDEARSAIEDSNISIIGAGSFYGSILAIIQHPGIRESLRKQQKQGGKLFALTNLIADPRDTAGWDGDMYIDKLTDALRDIRLHGVVANNDFSAFPAKLRDQAIQPPSETKWRNRGIKITFGKLAIKNGGSYHDPRETASAIKRMVTA